MVVSLTAAIVRTTGCHAGQRTGGGLESGLASSRATWNILAQQSLMRFMGLDDVHDAKSAAAELAAFRVAGGVAGAERRA